MKTNHATAGTQPSPHLEQASLGVCLCGPREALDAWRRRDLAETASQLAGTAGTARKDALPLTVQSLPDNNEFLSPPGNRCFRGPFFCAASLKQNHL